ncbi:uncharacterized protein ACWYII_044156 isoform 1-T1 [Salvelinus alpinus]
MQATEELGHFQLPGIVYRSLRLCIIMLKHELKPGFIHEEHTPPVAIKGYVTLAFAVYLVDSISAMHKGCLQKMQDDAINDIRPKYNMDAMWTTYCGSWIPKHYNKTILPNCIFKWSHCPLPSGKCVMEELRKIQCSLASSAKGEECGNLKGIKTRPCKGAQVQCKFLECWQIFVSANLIDIYFKS